MTEVRHTTGFAPASMPTKRVALSLFNRATYARMRSLVEYLSRYPNVDLTVLLSGAVLWEEYGNARKTYIERELHPIKTAVLPVEPLPPGFGGITKVSADILRAFGEWFAAHPQDLSIVIGDRFETLPCAMAAAYQNVPLVHVQGGEITGNIDDRVRHSVTKIADYHFVSSALAREYVIAMGEDRARVFQSGCPSVDAIASRKINRHQSKERYFLCIFHPETENQEEAEAQTKVVLQASMEYALKRGSRCYWYWPNPDPGRERVLGPLEAALREFPAHLTKVVNEDPDTFLRRLSACQFIAGNSSSGIRESSFLGVPAVNVGDRQKFREQHWNVENVPFDVPQILAAMEKQLDVYKYPKSHLFGRGVSAKYIAYAIARLDPSLKPPLQYPLWIKYKERHFGGRRFEAHRQVAEGKTTRAKPAPSSEARPEPLRGQPGPFRGADQGADRSGAGQGSAG